MKRYFHFMLLATMILTLQCKTMDSTHQKVDTILMDEESLINTKVQIEKNDPKLKDAFDQLIKKAEKAISEGPFSVTHKEKLAPSGDKHDYASYSRYWWPDPDTPDGLPYVRRDGETNPESQSLKASDRQRIGALGANAETLGLAYYFTGEEKYATKVAELIRVWFLDTETRMNPNLNHAQCRLGHNNGSRTGVLDGRLMIGALEGAAMIANSPALTDEERKRLKSWSEHYFEWLLTNEMALEEAAANNNHGSFYDVQAMYFALYSGNPEAATRIAKQFIEQRLSGQIKADGAMPEELGRTRPVFYTMYNLHAMFLVAHLAEQVDVDVWQVDKSNPSIQIALDFILPYIDPEKTWPQPTVGKANMMELFPILVMADRVYPDKNYLKRAEELPQEQRIVHRYNLAFPMIR